MHTYMYCVIRGITVLPNLIINVISDVKNIISCYYVL